MSAEPIRKDDTKPEAQLIAFKYLAEVCDLKGQFKLVNLSDIELELLNNALGMVSGMGGKLWTAGVINAQTMAWFDWMWEWTEAEMEVRMELMGSAGDYVCH